MIASGPRRELRECGSAPRAVRAAVVAGLARLRDSPAAAGISTVIFEAATTRGRRRFEDRVFVSTTAQ